MKEANYRITTILAKDLSVLPASSSILITLIFPLVNLWTRQWFGPDAWYVTRTLSSSGGFKAFRIHADHASTEERPLIPPAFDAGLGKIGSSVDNPIPTIYTTRTSKTAGMASQASAAFVRPDIYTINAINQN